MNSFPIGAWILLGLTLAVVLVVAAVVFLKAKATQDSIDALEGEVRSLTAKMSNSTNDSSFADIKSKLANLESALAAAHDLIAEQQRTLQTAIETLAPPVRGSASHDVDILERQYQEALSRANRNEQRASEAEEAQRRMQQDVETNRRNNEELRQEVKRLKDTLGTATVGAGRAGIAAALELGPAAIVSGLNVAEAEQARTVVREQGEALLKALDSALAGNPDSAASLLDTSLFDPFSYSAELWESGQAAKRVLEAARAAALREIESVGFTVDRPRVRLDSFDDRRHNLRDTIITNRAELKGRIAEVRRPGLLQNGAVVRPARVVQYAIDYEAGMPIVSEPEPYVAPEPEEPTRHSSGVRDL